jgi:anti-sigma regulatory factor (Ser/Thr protein kinase)
MRMGGTVALDMGRAPGASAGAHAAALACDLCVVAAQATALLRHGAEAVVRGVVAAVRTHGPVVAALVTSFRSRSTPWAATIASPHAGGAHVHRSPTAMPRPRRSVPVGSADAGHRELVLPADPTAPGTARAFLRCAAQDWAVDDDLAQDAAMVLTELVANAVDHARSASTLSLGMTHEGLTVAVRDAAPGPVPRPAPIDPTAARGRGLQMVDALTTAWGVTLHAGGKTVWAVLNPAGD